MRELNDKSTKQRENNKNEYMIRFAKRQDTDAMYQLILQLAEFEKAKDHVNLTKMQFIKDGFGKYPAYKALVADVDGEIAALALYFVRYSTWKGKMLYLEDLIVGETHRGKGIGKDLLLELKSIAKKDNIAGLCWQVLDWNTPAINFYKKLGAELEEEWRSLNWWV